MPKQVRTPLIPSANGATERDAAISRTILQSFFEPGRPEPTSGQPTADAGSAQVVDDTPLTARGTSLVRAAAAVNGAPKALPDIAKIAQKPREAPPSRGRDDTPARTDDAWQTYSDVSFTSEGYLPDESPFDPPNRYASGFGRTPPPQLTDQQKAAIDMILCGKKLGDIAGKLGIHPSTLWRWRRHDLDFRRTLSLASQRAMMHSVEQLRQLVPKAVEIVHSETENESFHAAMAVLRLVHRHLETYEHMASQWRIRGRTSRVREGRARQEALDFCSPLRLSSAPDLPGSLTTEAQRTQRTEMPNFEIRMKKLVGFFRLSGFVIPHSSVPSVSLW